MRLYRDNQIDLDDELYFYARILTKALVHGTDASITIDQYCRNCLREKWTNEHPELVEAYERNNELRQASRKAYQQHEDDIIKLITPVPGGKKVLECETRMPESVKQRGD